VGNRVAVICINSGHATQFGQRHSVARKAVMPRCRAITYEEIARWTLDRNVEVETTG
jgi:hypothetical protein